MLSSGKLPMMSPDLVTEILATASDIALLVAPTRRVVTVLVNPHHRSFGQLADWEGARLNDLLTEESQRKFDLRLADLGSKTHGPMAVELNHVSAEAWDFPVRYSIHQISKDGSLLMLGRDLRPIAEVQQQLVAAQLALERDYEAQREADTRYRVLLEVSRDPVLMVSMSSGRITDLNPAAAVILGGSRVDLVGSAVAQEFDGRRRGEFLEMLANNAGSETAAPMELTARRSQRRVLVTSTLFRAAGERIVLCQIDPAEKQAAQTDDLAENLARLYHEGVDGIVFADAEGVIRAANEAFLNLTDAASMAAVRGRSIADYLARGAVDLRVLLDNVKRTGQLRMYATRLTTDYSGQIAVEISASWLNDRPNPVLVLVVRDASRAESLRRSGAGVTDEGTRSMMELVGSSTLKDIVAETTDVIEKMCIETALELTRNNRVAAAEMLSLSRQSLYVKLRKYGLLNKDGDQAV
ncbi:MAG: transcriptional regulator PpsR [Tabrizicola sp.]|uniref:transcriptional regulator PpsR n=1 Tax=Tabrizicola sp. TaxID=2005166 RepID=UPI002732B8FB|nr:transcriptional regulator PpsR [Tabrizicola sp.]MDP3265141.1 transcriptional regulator PpsR [Tabrizicola sp.]MDP3646909.1 transcriptional regulator PpsR [Paracoccaceae bacterium]